MKVIKKLYQKCLKFFTPKTHEDINNERFEEIFDIIQSCYYIRSANYKGDFGNEMQRWNILFENYAYINFLHKSELYNSLKQRAIRFRDKHNDFVEREQHNNEPIQEPEEIQLDKDALREIAEREYIDELKANKKAEEMLEDRKKREAKRIADEEKENQEREDFYKEWNGDTFEDFKTFLESKNIDTTNLKEEYVDLNKK